MSFRVTHVRRKWAGLRTFASDRSPAVGMEESTPGFFWLAGQGGYGIQTAPVLARAAAKLLVEGVLPDDLLSRGLVAAIRTPMGCSTPCRVIGNARTLPGAGGAVPISWPLPPCAMSNT